MKSLVEVNQAILAWSYSDQELFVPDPDPTRMKEQMNKSFISNFRPVDSGLKYL